MPQAYTPGASMASIGGGTYNGESAVALGVSMVSANGRWVLPLNREMRKPATMAVTRPWVGESPHAIAKAIASGMAPPA